MLLGFLTGLLGKPLTITPSAHIIRLDSLTLWSNPVLLRCKKECHFRAFTNYQSKNASA